MSPFTVEQQVLLELLKASLFRETPVLPESIRWDRVYKEAEAQAIVALVEPVVPREHRQKWTFVTYKIVAHSTHLFHEQTDLVRLFTERSIPMVILKGTAASMYYPEPPRRAMGDIDFLVPINRFADAQGLMERSGYRFILDNERHVEYEKNGVSFELHRYFSSMSYKDIDHFIISGINNCKDYSIGNNSFPGLPTCENGIVLLGHIMQHLKGSGLGLRQVIDWMMFVHQELGEEVWEKQFKQLAREAGLEKLALALTLACKKWLGLPDEVGWCYSADEQLAQQLLQHILIDGNFGQQRPEGEDVWLAIKNKGVFRYLQQSGLTNWKAAEKYPFLRSFAWLYQLLRCVRSAFVEAIKGINVFSSLKTADDKKTMWKQLE